MTAFVLNLKEKRDEINFKQLTDAIIQ